MEAKVSVTEAEVNIIEAEVSIIEAEVSIMQGWKFAHRSFAHFAQIK